MMSVTTRTWIATKSLYFRVTLNRVTLAFFFFAFVHCFTQGILQAFLFGVDDDWGQFTSAIVGKADIGSAEFTQFTGGHSSWSLEICDNTPVNGVKNACVPFFAAGQKDAPVPAGYKRSDEDGLSQASFNVDTTWLVGQSNPITDIIVESVPSTDSGLTSVVVSQVGNAAHTITLNPTCTRSLTYPAAKLSQSRREEISLIASQFWFFGLSVFAIVFESIPHLMALVIARVLATGWSAYDVWRTQNMSERFQNLIAGPDTPCRLDIYEPYFRTRVAFQIADLILHCTALLLSVYLSWRLIKVYRTHTFNRVGPPPGIIKIYRYFLAVLVGLQLSVFFLLVATALWVDQLINSAIAYLSWHTVVYKAAFISTNILLIPWIMMGWFAVRREKKALMIAFLATDFVLIAEWSLMFYSEVYRFTFIDWPFFAAMTIISFLVMIHSGAFGIVCWVNFDKGLAEWLYVEKSLARSDFEPELFARDATTEKTWRMEEDRASMYLTSVPTLLSDGLSRGPTPPYSKV
ncbi:hypothetical protein FA95DRAFT_1537748 [Auriscalpium vulgare]|uniref:Uncharacterized protein n=1 Tax=Auriscalpium vulgare TaxID=40419 RepID=A0ACB8S105_9AGAM|nr:hypothetical protein FA95DRAFT_1537748 [Auriscalpium vulgare]